MTSKFLIYALSDPRTGEIRYVGKSSNGLKRARTHEYPSCLGRERTKCRNWIVSLHALDLKPLIEVVEEHVDHNRLIEAECFWISQFKALGFNLTNHTDGGEGCLGRKMSSEVKEKLRSINLGSTRTESARLKISDAQRGRKQSPVTVAKRSAAMIGKNNKQVIDNNGVIYSSCWAASNALNISSASISRILRGKQKNSSIALKYMDGV